MVIVAIKCHIRDTDENEIDGKGREGWRGEEEEEEADGVNVSFCRALMGIQFFASVCYCAGDSTNDL